MDMRRTAALMITSGLALVLMLLMALAARAVAPTEEAYKIWEQQGVLEQKIAIWQAFKAAGGSFAAPSPFDPTRRAARLAAGINAPDTLPVLVIMVDFSDKTFPSGPQNGTPDKFDSILFSDKLSGGRVNPSGSMIDYYREVSYGAVQIRGTVVGPFRMPWTYTTYVGSDDGTTLSSTLARQAVDSADRIVDYSQFVSQTGQVNGVVILHPGAGAETGASPAIWSHMGAIAGYPSHDGVAITTYTIDPEEFGNQLQPIGVFCHEHGHVLGLPDLYDVDTSHTRSQGLGSWSLMASGNYNGNSKYPAHPDPWCKRTLNWIPQFIDVSSNMVNVRIPAAEFSPVVYRIRDTSVGTSEYWLIENRQGIGSDYGLPGSGLLIYHVDPIRMGWPVPNIDTLHYGIGVEQADGLDQLALAGSRGDGADPWPGSTNNRNFTDQSSPNSRLYSGATTEVGVWNISNSDSVMTADLDYSFSRPYITFDEHPDSLLIREAIGGNGDGVFDAGETVELFCRINNFMRDAYGWSMTLETSNPDVEFLTNHVRQVSQPGYPRLLYRQYNPNVANVPVTFRLKPGSKPSYTTFTLRILADSMFGTFDELFSKDFQFTIALGAPKVLVVDDDDGTKSDSVISSVFRRLNVPTKTWNKATLGSPSGADLSGFSSVFWVHGKKPTGTLTAADVAGLKTYLNGGENRNFCMASATAAQQLQTLDSAFLADYLHARFIDTTTSLVLWFFGKNGGHLGDSTKFKYGQLSQAQLISLGHMANIAPVAPGIRAFVGAGNSYGSPAIDTVGVTYSGSYKTVLLTFPIEFLSDADMAGDWKTRDTILSRILGFFGGASTSIDDPVVHTLPQSFSLGQNFPNPFNPSTIITYALSASENGRPATVNLSVYNLLGEKIITLVNKVQRPGNYAVAWNGTDRRGAKVASGVYFYRLSYGEQSATRKMMLLK